MTPAIRVFPAMVAGALAFLLPTGTSAQTASSGAGLQSGIYLEEQADRGASAFVVICSACHGDFDLLAPAFVADWSGRSLRELYLKIKDTMPEDNRGVLTPAGTTEIMAYMLRAQGFPAGAGPLEPNEERLAEILIGAP
jgi:mono/diheme cytochrome c family protein